MNGYIFLLPLILIAAILGVLIWTFWLQRKRPLRVLYRQRTQEPDFCPYDRIPERLRYFVCQLEDRAFFTHRGYDASAIFYAFRANLKAGKIQYGGSTITQQLIKNLYFRFRKSHFRKCAELILAVYAEKVLGKQKILELYLNIVYFGNGKYGVADAARFYFGVAPDRLTEEQMFSLACLLPAPDMAGKPEGFAYLLDKALENLLNHGTLSEEAASHLSACCVLPGYETKSRPKAAMQNERFGPSNRLSRV